MCRTLPALSVPHLSSSLLHFCRHLPCMLISTSPSCCPSQCSELERYRKFARLQAILLIGLGTSQQTVH